MYTSRSIMALPLLSCALFPGDSIQRPITGEAFWFALAARANHIVHFARFIRWGCRRSVAGVPGSRDMQRPVMNPTFFEEHAPAAPKGRFRLLRPIARLFKLIGRILFYKPLSRRLRVDDGLGPFS